MKCNMARDYCVPKPSSPTCLTLLVSFMFLYTSLQLLIRVKYYTIFFTFQGKFPPFYQYTKTFNSDTFDYSLLKDSEHVFMRWKEHFLVPDHTVKDINGASFAGFYYICFQKSAATIDGYYYHRTSEW